MTTERVIDILKQFTSFTPCVNLCHWLDVDERQLRKLVEEIRANDLAKGYVLISSDKGYKLSDNADEINAFLRRYLSSARTMIATSKHAKKFLSEQQTKDIQMELNF